MPTPLTPTNPTNAFPPMAVDSSQLPAANPPNPPNNAPSQNPFLENSFNKTSLDLEDRFPFGGPINDPSSNFTHFYTPQKPYMSVALVLEPQLKFRTDSTNLDLENPLPNGGPINVPYTTRIGNQSFTFSTTQPFTPRKTYADSFNPIPPGILR